jgi:hypothetical protein
MDADGGNTTNLPHQTIISLLFFLVVGIQKHLMVSPSKKKHLMVSFI